MHTYIINSIQGGLDYLLCHQFPDGHWEDYDLPVGPSDAWVTSYVGLAVLRAGAHKAGQRAASWLLRNQIYPYGWSYNASTHVDADSTGWALQLLTLAGLPNQQIAQEWLLARWRPDGGFATYEEPGSWGIAHPDVTPVAYAALNPEIQQSLRPALIKYLRRVQTPEGDWPAYWWRTRHYCTFLNNQLIQSIGAHFPIIPPVVSFEESRAIYSAFDLAFVVANTLLFNYKDQVNHVIVSELINLQTMNGSWPGGPNLRVTRHDCRDPWNNPIGNLYTDVNHLITTASVISILSRITPSQLCDNKNV